MRILGIDLGTTSIKGVEIDSAFGRYEIRDYYENPVDPGAGPAQAISRLIQSLPKLPDRIAIALPVGMVTFRNLHLPTRDRKAIIAGVGFELDDELPFSLEKAHYDFSILSQSKQATDLHVAATLKKHLTALLETWNSAGVDPDLITTEGWAYRTLVNRVIPLAEQEEPLLLLQIGHERSTMYIHWKGNPVLAREVSWGGRDLTSIISQRYGIPIEQAETAKLDHGFVVPPSQKLEVTREQFEFSEMLMEPIRNLIAEIRQAEFTCKNTTHATIGTVYLTGGTSLLPGLARVIEEMAYVRVKPLPALSSVATSGVTYSEHTDAVFLSAAAVALCLVGPDRDRTISFRKGEFSKKGSSREFNLTALKRPLLGLGAIATCLFLSLIVESQFYKSRLKDVDSQLEKSLKSFFGSVSNSAVKSYMASTSTLRDSITRELKKQRELGNLVGPNPHSPLEFLKTVSSTIPRDVIVDTTVFQAGAAPTAGYSSEADSNATLTFLIPRQEFAERLNTLLSSKMSGIQRGKLEEVKSTDGTPSKWRVSFTGKPTEAAYGK